MTHPDVTLSSLADAIPDGAMLAIPPDNCGAPIAATLALIRRKARNLHLVCVPQSGLQAELLIGAGAVRTVETAAITLGEFGPAHRFAEALRAGRLRVLDATCPAIHAGLQAAQKGLPFMPLRGLIGSDLVPNRPDWKVIDNPFSGAVASGPSDGPGDPIVLLPAIAPDCALFHAPLADRHGNVFIGRKRELLTMAQASRRTFVTVEELFPGNLLDDDRAAGVIPAIYVTAVAVAPLGTWPLPFLDRHPGDDAMVSRYVELSRTQEGFDRFLDELLSRQAVAA
jgi:glutaconate CoA-transferase subunit A